MSEVPTPVIRSNLMDEVAQRLRDMVMDGRLEPGTRLNERVLCEQLEVSRTPLREAYRMLATEGLLELLPNRGAIVAPLSLAELDDTIEVLAALEELAGGLAATRIDEEELRRVQALHHEMVAHFLRRELKAYFEANQAIHFAILAATGNAVLEREYRVLNARVRRYRYIANLSAERWQESIEEHETIMELLTARDGPRLARQLRVHLMNKLAAVKQRLALNRDVVDPDAA